MIQVPGSILKYRSALPEELRGISHLPWIPWRWVRRNYSAGAPRPMSALFRAYQRVAASVDLDSIGIITGDNENDRCRRCGMCCATLNPGLTEHLRYQEWIAAGNPIGSFIKMVARQNASEAWYAGWFMGEFRLRMCPLLFYCGDSDAHFCAVYHFGPGQRPEACENFRPNPPHCEVSQRPLVP
ncbi:MAG: hypothetical protein P1S46_11490 [bacterium]|nr:hypothetical protein [bacterium]MDT8367313.1 hypothetical protein [bacterium]